MEAWHFVRDDKRLGYGHNETVAAGYIYSVEGQIALCKWGMHASVRALDALYYAPGPYVCRVNLSGEIIVGDDKVVAQSREVLWCADATSALHEFACRVAENALRDASIIDARCWAAIDAKRRWQRGEISDYALAAAKDAARDAAITASSNAAGAVAWNAARDAAKDAARDAAITASSNAAGAVAWDAARSAAYDANNNRLESMLWELNQ